MGIGSIGKYERLDVLGHGTSGVVYLAWDTLLRRQVALKEIRAAGPELERVLEEARVLDRLGEHPHIVRIHGVDYTDGVILIDMELVRGRNLAEAMRDRNDAPFPPQEAVRIVLDVLEALEYAHERRIIHRDVKPANILMGPDGLVKLTDFGLAEALGTGSVAGGGGTYPYMAPEDFSDNADSDYRSDLWAVGVVLYELLTGRRPFTVAARTKDPFAWMRVIREEEPPRLSELRPDLPASLDDILRRALAKSKAARFSTARLFADSLRAAALSLQSATALPEPSVVYAAPLSLTPTTSTGGGPAAFVFGNGQTVAYTLDELLAGAAKHWDEGRHALVDGRFEVFLRAIGEVYIAELAGELAGKTGESADRRLREFLERSRADEPAAAAAVPQDATLPLIRRNQAENEGSLRLRRRLLRRAAPAPTDPPGPIEATIAAPSFKMPSPPLPFAPAPQTVEEIPDREARRKEKKNRQQEAERVPEPTPAAHGIKARWWFWPLYLLVIAPPGVALVTRAHLPRGQQGTFPDTLEAWAITGALSAMLLLVGVGVRVPVPARVACAFPLAGGLMAVGALVFTALGSHPTPDKLLGVSFALFAPLVVVLVQSTTVRALWRLWAWVVFIAAALTTFVYLH